MRKIVVKKNQKKVVPLIWMGEEKKIDYQISLEGKGAELQCLILLLGKGKDKIDAKVRVIHKHPHTKSEVVVKGALKGSSKASFEGSVEIKRGARGSNAWLASHLLLLSSEAEAMAVPNLEIAENEVKAGHALTVGRVNENELFYLMSRGLTKETAKKLVVQGFLNDFIRKFPQDVVQGARKKLRWI